MFTVLIFITGTPVLACIGAVALTLHATKTNSLPKNPVAFRTISH